jgi:uncharacterized protein YmfQ (DUF2313 family)
MQQAVLSGASYLDGLPVPLTPFGRLLGGIADELGRVHVRLNDLAREAVPATTSELLDEWETAAGLPEFGYIPTTDDDRRATLIGKLSARGGASAGYFEGLAESYGATPPVAVTDGPGTHEWTINLPGDVTRACCTSPCDAALVEFTTPAGERVGRALNHYKPAHTRIFWDGGTAS